MALTYITENELRPTVERILEARSELADILNGQGGIIPPTANKIIDVTNAELEILQGSTPDNPLDIDGQAIFEHLCNGGIVSVMDFHETVDENAKWYTFTQIYSVVPCDATDVGGIQWSTDLNQVSLATIGGHDYYILLNNNYKFYEDAPYAYDWVGVFMDTTDDHNIYYCLVIAEE